MSNKKTKKLKAPRISGRTISSRIRAILKNDRFAQRKFNSIKKSLKKKEYLKFARKAKREANKFRAKQKEIQKNIKAFYNRYRKGEGKKLYSHLTEQQQRDIAYYKAKNAYKKEKEGYREPTKAGDTSSLEERIRELPPENYDSPQSLGMYQSRTRDDIWIDIQNGDEVYYEVEVDEEVERVKQEMQEEEEE